MTIERLTILHLNTERGWRGGERQTLWLAQGLAQEGHRAIIVARPGQPLAQRSAETGLEVIVCSPVLEFDLAAARVLHRHVLADGVDVLHAHTAHALALAALAARGTPVRVVITRRTSFRLHSNPLTRWKYRHADAVIAVSARVKRSLLDGGVDAALVEVIPDGTRLDRDVAPSPRSTLGVPDDAPLAVMVGALTREKDPGTFVRAVACALREVPTLRALLVGDGPMRRELDAQVESLGIGHSLRLTGYRDDADALIAASDMVVLSSRDEGLGSILLDAMAFGKPVVATTAGGIPDVVVQGETGLLVEPCDAEALGEGIARVACDRELASRLARGARERAPRFSMREAVVRTTAVYERVLAASGLRGAA